MHCSIQCNMQYTLHFKMHSAMYCTMHCTVHCTIHCIISASLITADGAYHCPVSSILPFLTFVCRDLIWKVFSSLPSAYIKLSVPQTICSFFTHQLFELLKTGWTVCRGRVCQSCMKDHTLMMQFVVQHTWIRGRCLAWWVSPGNMEVLCGGEVWCRTGPWCISRRALECGHPLSGGLFFI